MFRVVRGFSNIRSQATRRDTCCFVSPNEHQRNLNSSVLPFALFAEQAVETLDMCFLVTESGVSQCDLTAAAWLQQAPRGAYTTSRTVKSASVFELSFHIDRLATTSRLMMEEEERQDPTLPHNRHPRLTSPSALRPRVMKSLQTAASAYRQAHSHATGELKFTTLITWNNQNFQVFTHVSALGARPSPPIQVEVRGVPRQNAAAKDSEWVRQRQVYEDKKPDGINEVLLVAVDGGVYEGLTSNFFALVDGALHTAGDDVLMGSVREAVLRVAARENLPVVLKAPSLRDLDRWEGAFISSTSRLLLPIDVIFVPDATPPLKKILPTSALARELEAAVMQEVEACSEPIFT